MIVYIITIKQTFALMQHYKYSLTELENMMPWEREIYLTLLNRMDKKTRRRT